MEAGFHCVSGLSLRYIIVVGVLVCVMCRLRKVGCVLELYGAVTSQF